MDYKSAGVDIDAGDEVVRRVKQLARGTFTSGVISEIGSFGGLFRPDFGGYTDPVLVASADGVGTKLRIAFQTDRHNTVGRDLVNHCVNDILVQGATPLFFLDYLAVGRLLPEVSASVIEGVATGCRDNGCALLGGETAEMPGFYGDGEYDLAGFIVGMADRERVIDGQRIEPGDRLIGLRSAGLHTNGYSLARQIVFETAGLSVESPLDDVEAGTTVADQLLRPHRSYLRPVQSLLNEDQSRDAVRGLAHITGGGLTDNLPRILPAGSSVKIDPSSWVVPPLFRFLQDVGDVPDPDMYRTFNMGIGMVIVCASNATAEVVAHLGRSGESDAVIIGEVVDGDGSVIYV